jgi:hypothetical protein
MGARPESRQARCTNDLQFVYNYGPELIGEHQQLVRAIRAGNPELARTRAIEYFANTSRRSINVDLRWANLGVASLAGEETDRLPTLPARGAWAKKCEPARRRRKLLPR